MVVKRVILAAALVVIVLLAYVWYRGWKAQQTLDSGAVYPQSGSSTGTYSRPNSAATGNVPAPSSTSNQPPGGAPAPVNAAAPVTDSQAPNNPDNMRFGAAGGRYQWYRQGNLTWRVDSQTGDTCIDFATEDEWRKPRVYQNGCNSR